MAKLIINGHTATLGSARIALNKAAYNWFNFNNRFVGFSRAFNLPRCTENDAIFNRGDNLAVNKNRYNVYYNFVYQDAEQVLFSGKLKLLETTNTAYNIQLLDSAIDFFDNITDRSLQDINSNTLDAQDFTFGLTAFNALKQSSITNAWVWSATANNIDKQSTSIPGTEASLKYSRPLLRVDWLVNKIFNEADFTYNDTFLEAVENLAISVNHEAFYVCSYLKEFDQTYSVNETFTVPDLDTNTFEYNAPTTSTTIDVGSIDTRIVIRGTITTDSDAIEIAISSDSTTSADTQEQRLVLATGTNEVFFVSDVFSTSEANNYITIKILANGDVTFNCQIYTRIEEQAFGDLSTNPLLNYRVRLFDNMPDVAQKDLIKELLNVRGLYFNSLNAQQQIQCFPYSELNQNFAIDWSDKVERNTISVTGTNSSYAQNSRLTYNNDDATQANTGRGTIAVNDITIVDEATIYTSLFGASEEVRISGHVLAYFGTYNDTERENTINIRLVEFYEESTYTIAKFENLAFDKVLSNKYASVLPSLQKQEIVEINAYLNRVDYLSFNFTQAVYIGFLRSTFFVISLQDYIEKQPTEVTLLKIQGE